MSLIFNLLRPGDFPAFPAFPPVHPTKGFADFPHFALPRYPSHHASRE